MKLIVEVHGEQTFILDPEEEKYVRDTLAREENPAFELAYGFDSWISDIDTDVAIIVEDEDGTVLLDEEL